MRISHEWLNEYIEIGLSPDRLAEGLSMLGLEVAEYHSIGESYDGFVVGNVIGIEKHPNADKLTVCRVNIGKKDLQIVCGASNVEVGQKVAVGMVGAIVPRNQHDPSGKPFRLEHVKIRGVESEGMICSEYELDLGDDADNILVLDGKARPGTPLAKHLGKRDVYYEMEPTANRGDWLSHIGVAREVSALTGKKWKLPTSKLRESSVKTARHAKVRILDREGCPRYTARVIRNVTVGPSPQWMQERLLAVGLRPINNIVDITNYVLMETGQPLHAFDYDLIAGGTIVVRCAQEGEKFTTLDGKERTLSSSTLLICDAEKPVAIAGVMGGMNSEISDQTTNVLLESAYFDPRSIRRTSKALGLSTDASQRFERAVDVEMVVYASDRAAEFLRSVAGGEVLKGIIDVYPRKMVTRKCPLRVDRTNATLGTGISSREISSLLKRLGFKAKQSTKIQLEVAIPSHRNDVHEEIDLIEEVARVFGYDKIETKMRGAVRFAEVSEPRDFLDEVRLYWEGAGFNEMIANSLLNKSDAALPGEPSIGVLNPVSVEMAALRTSMIPGALHVVQGNLNQFHKNLRLFEVGRTYHFGKEGEATPVPGHREEHRLLIVVTGKVLPQQYGIEVRDVDIFDLKGEVESFLGKFFLDKHRFICYDSHKPLSVDNIDVEIQDTYVGFLGKIRKEVLTEFDIGQDVFICELKLDKMSELRQRGHKVSPLPRYPAVVRDLAFVVPMELPFGDLERVIRGAGGPMLRDVVLFDVFVGENLGTGLKSMACTVTFQPTEKTLTDAEVNGLVQRIVGTLGTELGATLRS